MKWYNRFVVLQKCPMCSDTEELKYEKSLALFFPRCITYVFHKYNLGSCLANDLYSYRDMEV